jgi:hypothetical protein
MLKALACLCRRRLKLRLVTDGLDDLGPELISIGGHGDRFQGHSHLARRP